MNCPFCQKDISPSASLCPYCGNAVSETALPPLKRTVSCGKRKLTYDNLLLIATVDLSVFAVFFNLLFRLCYGFPAVFAQYVVGGLFAVYFFLHVLLGKRDATLRHVRNTVYALLFTLRVCGFFAAQRAPFFDYAIPATYVFLSVLTVLLFFLKRGNAPSFLFTSILNSVFTLLALFVNALDVLPLSTEGLLLYSIALGISVLSWLNFIVFRLMALCNGFGDIL